MIVFKCLHGLAPSYVADDCVLASAAAGRRHLRSADTMKLLVRRTKTVVGAREFAISAAAIWNSPSNFKTVFLLGSDICVETENFLRQRDDVAHQRTIYFALCLYSILGLSITVLVCMCRLWNCHRYYKQESPQYIGKQESIYKVQKVTMCRKVAIRRWD